MKLLIADDNAPMRALLCRIFATFGTETRDCADGIEAVRAFNEFMPDWTVMDVSMPGLDGLAATRQILAAHPGARIIVLTNYCSAEYEQAAREAGAYAFVRKDNLHPLFSLLLPPPPPPSTSPRPGIQP
jgi:CheY-like chemotaxis protein